MTAGGLVAGNIPRLNFSALIPAERESSMIQGTKPGWGWKSFAGLMVVMVAIGDVPKLFHPIGVGALLTVAINLTAVAGLVAYAFRRRMGPTRFWRLFAPFFCLFTVGLFGAALPIIVRFFAIIPGSLTMVLGMLIAIVPVTAMALLTAVALLRQGELLGPGRRPLGARPDQLTLPLHDPA